MPIEEPWDHNGECLHCDELGMHRADCLWLVGLIDQVAELQTHVREVEIDAASNAAGIAQLLRQLEAKEQIILNQVRNLGSLRRELDETHRLYVGRTSDLLDMKSQLDAKNDQVVVLAAEATKAEAECERLRQELARRTDALA